MRAGMDGPLAAVRRRVAVVEESRRYEEEH